MLSSGCGGLALYDVTRTPIEDCDITPGGEFCGDVGPAVSEKYAIEIRDNSTIIYVGEETWIDDVVEGDRNIIKEERITREPGPCTSTRRRELRFSFQNEGGADESLSGSYEIRTRLEGPDACGPRRGSTPSSNPGRRSRPQG